MIEYLFLEALGAAIAFGLGYLHGRGRKEKHLKVKIPDYVPTDWKIGKGEG